MKEPADTSKQLSGHAGASQERHAARWRRDGGKRAGPVRNQRMAALGANVCLAFPRPGSRGTQSAIAAAQKHGILTYVTTEADGVNW